MVVTSASCDPINVASGGLSPVKISIKVQISAAVVFSSKVTPTSWALILRKLISCVTARLIKASASILIICNVSKKAVFLSVKPALLRCSASKHVF